MSAFGIKKDWVEIMNYYGEEDKESFSMEDFQAIMNDNMADRYSKHEIDKIYDVFDMDGHGITVDNIKNIAKEIGKFLWSERKMSISHLMRYRKSSKRRIKMGMGS